LSIFQYSGSSVIAVQKLGLFSSQVGVNRFQSLDEANCKLMDEIQVLRLRLDLRLLLVRQDILENTV